MASSGSGRAPRSSCTVHLGWVSVPNRAWVVTGPMNKAPCAAWARVRGHSAPSRMKSSPGQGRAEGGWPVCPHTLLGRVSPSLQGSVLGAQGMAEALGSGG